MIQPHGALLAVEEHDLVVVTASANTERVLRIPHERLLGVSLADAVGPAGERTLREAIAGGGDGADTFELAIGGERFDATLHRAGELLVLEFERPGRRCLERAMLSGAERLQAVERVAEVAGVVAAELRALTGFDRVTVYRYHAESVEVVAEVHRADLPAPPPQPARIHELGVGERVRYVADPGAAPVPLVEASIGRARTAIDLSRIALRVPGEAGSGATLSIAIDRSSGREQPWGVVACEHAGPLELPVAVRLCAEGLVRQMAWQVQLREQLGDEIRASNMIKDEFLATVSHELRTPLNAMLGWLRLIESGQVAPERQPQAIATVTRNANVLAELVEELLDVSRVVSGKMQLDAEPISPIGVVEAALATIQPAAQAKAIRVATALDPQAGPVLADAHRLQQVIVNLLSNAVKFTSEHGRIDVRLERAGAAVELIVADDGAGIDPAFLPFVFERFRQSPATISRSKGLGLGLAIVSQLVELHGGQVSAASEGLGRGATFTVRLPIAAQRASTAGAVVPAFEPAPQLRGLRVLIVDDERDANELLHAVLAASGVEVTSASSAREALELVSAVRPDVLISDIGMPGVDGYELIQQLRARTPADGGHIPAIALTAYARSQDRSRGFLAGFDLYLAKPIDPAELTAVLVNLTGRRTGPIQPLELPLAVRGELADARILVVDDDEDGGELMADLLRRHGAIVEVARTAAAGAAAVRRFRPDILVSDLMLPDKDGFTFIRELRATGADDGGWIPAIAISGRVGAEDVKQAILAGFQLHIAKPVDPADLLGRLARLVARISRRN